MLNARSTVSINAGIVAFCALFAAIKFLSPSALCCHRSLSPSFTYCRQVGLPSTWLVVIGVIFRTELMRVARIPASSALSVVSTRGPGIVYGAFAQLYRSNCLRCGHLYTATAIPWFSSPAIAYGVIASRKWKIFAIDKAVNFK
jgi:hypothetical protein